MRKTCCDNKKYYKSKFDICFLVFFDIEYINQSIYSSIFGCDRVLHQWIMKIQKNIVEF